MRNFLGVDFFSFELGLQSAGFHFRKYKTRFLLRKYEHFLVLELESSISINIKKFFFGVEFFFIFRAWAGKCARSLLTLVVRSPSLIGIAWP